MFMHTPVIVCSDEIKYTRRIRTTLVKFNDRIITEFNVHSTRVRDVKTRAVVKTTASYAFALPRMQSTP